MDECCKSRVPTRGGAARFTENTLMYVYLHIGISTARGTSFICVQSPGWGRVRKVYSFEAGFLDTTGFLTVRRQVQRTCQESLLIRGWFSGYDWLFDRKTVSSTTHVSVRSYSFEAGFSWYAWLFDGKTVNAMDFNIFRSCLDRWVLLAFAAVWVGGFCWLLQLSG